MLTDVFICSAIDHYSDTRDIRRMMRFVSEYRWRQESGVHPIFLEPGEGNIESFQRTRRITAALEARSDVYVLADDDCLLGPDPVIPTMLNLMDIYDDFAILSLLPQNAPIYPWTPGLEESRKYGPWYGNLTLPERYEIISNTLGSPDLYVTTDGWIKGTVFDRAMHVQDFIDRDPPYRDPYIPIDDISVMEHVSVGGIRFCRRGIPAHWPEMDPDNPTSYDQIHCEEIRRCGYRVGYVKGIKYNHLGEGYSTVWKENSIGKEERHQA